MSRADDIDQLQSPRVPLGGCNSSMVRRIERTDFSDLWVLIVSEAVMMLIEYVIEDCRLVAIAGGKQMPKITRLQIGERSNKVAIPAKRAIRIKPLKVEQRVSA